MASTDSTISKFTLITNPSFSGQCVGCMLATDIAPAGTLFVDLGSSIDFHGALIICQWCIAETFRVVGIKDEQVSALEAKAEHLSNQVEKYAKEVEKLNAAMDALLAVRPGSDPRVLAESNESGAGAEVNENIDGKPESDSSARKGIISGSDESDSERRPTNLPKSGDK